VTTIGREAVRALFDQVFAFSQADQTEALLEAGQQSLTRFANNGIHQNVVERNARLRVRAVVGTRQGVATTNDLSLEGVRRVVAEAVEIARLQPENPDFPGLPAPRPIAPAPAYSDATATSSPESRARSVRAVCQLAGERGLVASGALSTGVEELAIGNSLGVFAYDQRTVATFRTVVMSDDSSGYAERHGVNVATLDLEAAGREAVEKAVRGRGPVEVPPGVYPVVLEEYAVAELLEYMAYVGFGALAVQEGTSFLCDRFGQRVVDERISIWDDGHDPRGIPMAFDYEGVPKQRVTIVERGVARDVVYDSLTAHRAGRTSTGHALPQPNAFGPIPWNLFLGTGQDDRNELSRGVERGLWVTRFHYVNVAHARKGVLTGMTRDGTFLVERGEVTRPVKNLRFTQGVLEALSTVEGIGRTWRTVGSATVPALRLGAFTFTGATDLAS
jgi:predicted Zn-dependent protease